MKRNRKPTVVIVMPAYNAAQTVKDTFHEIPRELRKYIILVDDKSTDSTVAIAKKLGIQVFAHPQNLGYGGNQKTCYWEALKYHPDVVVMLHPDYQYDAKRIPALVEPILKAKYDFMFGSRMSNKGGALAGGMPLIKYYVNRVVCILENILLGVTFTEHFSGLRAYSPRLLKTVPFQRFSNDFVFDQQMEVSALSYGFRISEVPIETRYHERASSIAFVKGAKFLFDTFYVIFLFKLHEWGIVRSGFFAQNKITVTSRARLEHT